VLIVLTVTVVSALFFVTLTIGDLFTNLQTSIQSRLGKDSDITVTAAAFSESQLDDFCAGREDVEYVEKYAQTAGLYKPENEAYSKTVLVEATDLRSYVSRHGDYLVVGESYEYSSDCPEVWIGKSFAEENGVKAGDKIEIYIEISNSYRIFTVNYIFENYGIFANNVVNNVLIDFSSLEYNGLLTTANVKLKEGADKKAFSEELEQFFGGNAEVSDSVDYAEIKRVVESNRRLLRITLVFVTALMIFILFTSFLVVAKKRTNELVIFKTVGATNGQIAAMLIAEGTFYGLTGAVLGTVLGRIGMGIAVNKVIPNFPDAVSYTFADYILSVLFGVAVSALSAVFPIIKAGKESVRTATANKAKAVRKLNCVPLIISAVLLTVSAVLTAVFSGNAVGSVVFLVLAAGLFTYFAAPYLIRLVSLIFRGRGAGRLASLTVKRNNSSTALAGTVGAIMVFTFIIVSVVEIIIGAVTPANSRYRADFVVDSVISSDMRGLYSDLKDVYGVERAYLYVYDTCIWDKGDLKREFTLYGVDGSDALSGICGDLDSETKKSFDSEINPVIITYDLANRFGLSKGDRINLTLGTEGKTGEKLYDEFTVVGVDYTVTANDRLMVIRKDSFRVDGKEYLPKDEIIFLYASNNVPTDDLYRDLRDRAEKNSCYVLELNDWAYATSVGITGIKTLLRILQILVGVVAVAGIINLTAVTVMGRKREYDTLRAAGLDDRGYAIFSLCEGLVISVAGAVIGTILSAVVNVVIPDFAKIIDRYVDFRVFPWELGVIAAAFIVIYAAIYTLTALLRRKKDAVGRNEH